jgi:6-phosphogluconolactonase (cycloisomerase 2 family)
MTWNGLAWHDIDAQTGRPARKGVVECPASRQMLLGPGGKDLYLKACRGKEDRVFWYRLEADGKPVKAGEVAGKGIGASKHNDYPGILVIAPDAKHLYAVSAEDYAIARIERKPDGALAYGGAVDLGPIAKHDPGNALYLWTSLAISPDGKYVYASVRNGKPTENFYGIFRRDPGTGDLAFQEKFSGEQDPLANLKGWNMVFAPNGLGGYLGSFAGALATFKYDAQTGRLTGPAVVKETRNNGTSHLVLDAENGLLYVGGREFGYDRFFVFKVDKKAAKGP